MKHFSFVKLLNSGILETSLSDFTLSNSTYSIDFLKCLKLFIFKIIISLLVPLKLIG